MNENAHSFHDESAFKTYRRHQRLAYLLHPKHHRVPGFRQQPERIYLDVAPDTEPSGKPPVRIFVGTEPAQHRAERVLVFSILKVRDPARVYEIYLMKDLEGFDRREWKTGFTGYRYAIPALAGGEGRAIYNDVDQIYLTDPAELFDLEMDGAGQMSITERETSVMLLDCKKMSEVWDIEDASRMTRHKPFRLKVNAIPQLWRPLPREWNARDFEYEAGRSKLLHFTILHTQPWQPFPKQLKYQTHALADLWCALERAADESRFTMFTKAQPSSRFRQAQAAREAGKSGEDLSEKEPSWPSGLSEALVRHRKVMDGLIGQTGARSLLLCDSGHNGSFRKAADREADKQELGPLFANLELSWDDPLSKDSPGETTVDGVVATAPVAWCPDDDVAWVLDAMFARARRFVFMVADWDGFAGARGGGELPWLVQDPDWWRSQMACAARRHRGVRWTLCVSHRTWLGTRTNVFTEEV